MRGKAIRIFSGSPQKKKSKLIIEIQYVCIALNYLKSVYITKRSVEKDAGK